MLNFPLAALPSDFQRHCGHGAGLPVAAGLGDSAPWPGSFADRSETAALGCSNTRQIGRTHAFTRSRSPSDSSWPFVDETAATWNGCARRPRIASARLRRRGNYAHIGRSGTHLRAAESAPAPAPQVIRGPPRSFRGHPGAGHGVCERMRSKCGTAAHRVPRRPKSTSKPERAARPCTQSAILTRNRLCGLARCPLQRAGSF